MPALNTDKFRLGSGSTRPSPTSLALPKANGATTAELTSATGWNATTGVDVVMYRRQLNTTTGLYEKVANTQTDWIAVLTGTTLSSMVLSAGTEPASGYAADGNTVVICAPTAQWADDLVGGLLVSHKQDGTLLGTAVRAALGETASTGAGWSALGFTPNTVTYNGNRSYDLVFNGTDQTPTLSNGMRLRLTRTVSAPTQCASLNGTTQYFSKTSPAGMTFTDDFVTGAWVKLSSYPASDTGIQTCYNTTNGWLMMVNSSGQVKLVGQNGAGNQSLVTSFQSVPLNKWVHIAAELDMSAFTATPTTSYIMIDGVDVPATVSRTGTSPTALVQAGAYNIGSYNSGTSFFPGKIAQPFVTSAKLTQTQVRAIYSQGLTAADMTTYGIVSAFSLSGASGLTDINTTNNNSLTANGSATTTTTDAPWTQDDTAVPSGTTDFAIETKKVFSGGNTTITVQVPEGCTIPTSGGVATVSYSSNKVPYGFPAGTDQWAIYTIGRTNLTKASGFTAGSYYNTSNLNLNVPVGKWKLGYQASFAVEVSTGDAFGFSTISTSLSPTGTEAFMQFHGGGTKVYDAAFKELPVTVTTLQPWYLLEVTYAGGSSWTQLGYRGDLGDTIIKAECAYL